MSSPETYTLTDLARFCGVSRQAVYKRLRTDEQLRTEVDTHTVNQDGKKVYTVDALEVLKQAIQATNCKPECKPECKPDASELTQQVYRLTQEVDRLTQQVDTERKKHETERKTLTTEIDTLTAERDRLRDQLYDAAADRETLITQMNQYRQDFIDTKAEHWQQLNQLRQDHKEEVQRIQALYREQLDNLTEERDKLRQDLTEERQHNRDQSEKLAQLADQAQRLQLAQMQPPALLEDQQHKPTLWQRIFGRKKSE